MSREEDEAGRSSLGSTGKMGTGERWGRVQVQETSWRTLGPQIRQRQEGNLGVQDYWIPSTVPGPQSFPSTVSGQGGAVDALEPPEHSDALVPRLMSSTRHVVLSASSQTSRAHGSQISPNPTSPFPLGSCSPTGLPRVGQVDRQNCQGQKEAQPLKQTERSKVQTPHRTPTYSTWEASAMSVSHFPVADLMLGSWLGCASSLEASPARALIPPHN